MIVNKNLIEEFNLSDIDDKEDDEINAAMDEIKKETDLEIISGPNTIDHCKEIDKITEALPQVSGLDASDQEFDDLAEYGVNAYKDLMELAVNIEQRFAADVASAAGNMLGHAITAKTNKIKKKLDMINLQIKKQLADNKTKLLEAPNAEVIDGDSVLLDRTQLLEQLLKKPESKQD